MEMLVGCCSFPSLSSERSCRRRRRMTTLLNPVGVLQTLLILALLSPLAFPLPSADRTAVGETDSTSVARKALTLPSTAQCDDRTRTSTSKCANVTSSDVRNFNPWPNATIPYTITVDESLTDKEEYMESIREAMDWWENATCLQFIPNENFTSATPVLPLEIQIENSSERCFTYSGYHANLFRDTNLNKAYITLSCIRRVGSLAHEMGHTIGLLHEHIRPDRNRYITVDFDNILSDEHIAYYTADKYEYWDTHYDLGSIMHYSSFNGDAVNLTKPVLTVNDDIVFAGTVGQRECLSYYDITIVIFLYQCSDTAPPEKTECNFRTIQSSNSSNSYIYPGGTVAFKSQLSSRKLWLGCTENSNCYSWGCPGSKFSTTSHTHCWEYKFVVSPEDDDISMKTRLRFSDRIVLQQFRRCRGNSSDTNCPAHTCSALQCPSSGSQCKMSDVTSCASESGCPRRQVFRLEPLPGEEEGNMLKHRAGAVLVDDSTGYPVTCCVGNRRKRKRTCQLKTPTSDGNSCDGGQLHFTIYKL